MSALAYDPRLWPYGWFLPLVRRHCDDPCDPKNQGVLVHDRGVVLPVVFLTNMLDLTQPSDLRVCKRQEYSTLYQLLAEWKVD